ncbi:unnamed protein product [Hymenolepis diminuta]|uniref:NIF3-like protein 1 n=2 Tax=Hymenolepis diminuta TaxID=6216 RepID=A0A564Z1U3_HYMDI|nr:unnamed protein product [Hymenolepis diminuta]
MVMEFSKFVKRLDHIFKISLAESWDNVGLLIQPSSPITIKRIFLTNDLTEPVLNEAISNGANFIISYHPPVFRPFKRLTQNSAKERIIVKCIENKIAVYSPHTALDAVAGGLNDWLLSPFDWKHKRPLNGTKLTETLSTVAALKNRALREYCIENNVAPLNSDIPCLDGQVSEITVTGDAPKCLDIKLEDSVIFLPEEGAGRIALLNEGHTISGIVESFKKLLDTSLLKVALGYGKTFDSPVSALAVCAGSGGSMFTHEPMAQVADLLFTGEASYHDQLDAVSRGNTIITAGHSVSERGYLTQRLKPWLAKEIATLTDAQIPIDISSKDTEPGIYVC